MLWEQLREQREPGMLRDPGMLREPRMMPEQGRPPETSQDEQQEEPEPPGQAGSTWLPARQDLPAGSAEQELEEARKRIQVLRVGL
ncbi:hypothetical protein TURU_160786 [Turdus rufiventris]|nr:hypothetical protein TURU_160786 [Turdus rufiventris]